MIYELVYETKESLGLDLGQFINIGDFQIVGSQCYLCTVLSPNKLMEKLQNKPKFINCIQKKDLNQIDNYFVKNWCLKEFIKSDIIDFENSENGQKILQKLNDDINEIENKGVNSFVEQHLATEGTEEKGKKAEVAD